MDGVCSISDLLPPPFNAVIFFLMFLWFIMEIPLTLSGACGAESVGAIFGHSKFTWICSYCHATNKQMSKEEEKADLEEWMERIALERKDRVKLDVCEATLCTCCRRVKRPVSRFWYIGDKIGYVFAYTLILPVLCILLVPWAYFKKLLAKLTDVESNNETEFYQVLFEKQVWRVVFHCPWWGLRMCTVYVGTGKSCDS